MNKLTEKIEVVTAQAQSGIHRELAVQRMRKVLEAYTKEPVSDALLAGLLEAVLLTNPLQVTSTITRKSLSSTLSSLVLSVFIQGELIAKATIEAGPTELMEELELGTVMLADLRKKKTLQQAPLKERFQALLEETPSDRGDKKPGDTIRSRTERSAASRKSTLPEE